MPGFHHCIEPLAEDERNRRIYAGDIIIFRGFAAVHDLVATLAGHCRAHLGTDPQRAHKSLAEADANAAAETLRKAVLADATVADHFRRAFEAVGGDPACNYGDGVKQRVQLAHSRSGRRMVSPLGAHRDTWGSNIAAQTNWWAPVFPTTPERTLALFPSLFEQVVANDSEGWDFRELLRRLKEDGSDPDYPLLPLASQPPSWHEAVPVSLVPGDLMCFSGAHLHASVPNTTPCTRLSFEIRTVNGGDADGGHGAPNVDGRAVRTTRQLFRRLTDGDKLGAMT